MKLPVVWMSEAAAELRQARAWYDDIRTDLGERFAVAVEAVVEAIAQRPLQFPVVHRGRRRAGVRRFPYGIFFEVQEQNCRDRLLPREARSEPVAIAISFALEPTPPRLASNRGTRTWGTRLHLRFDLSQGVAC